MFRNYLINIVKHSKLTVLLNYFLGPIHSNRSTTTTFGTMSHRLTERVPVCRVRTSWAHSVWVLWCTLRTSRRRPRRRRWEQSGVWVGDQGP